MLSQRVNMSLSLTRSYPISLSYFCNQSSKLSLSTLVKSGLIIDSIQTSVSQISIFSCYYSLNLKCLPWKVLTYLKLYFSKHHYFMCKWHLLWSLFSTVLSLNQNNLLVKDNEKNISVHLFQTGNLALY